ncbi:MAG TPA: cupin domain-containing protein [Syntrophobacteraceae bacterium]|nr:cupin domain-containing protein [Syntrophobacteraceae bacterium]
MKIIHYSDVEPTDFAGQAAKVTRRVLLGKADGAKNYCMRLIELAPGGRVPPHIHAWEHEQFVYSGKGRALRGEEWVEFGPGTAMFVPGNARHALENTGDEPLLIVCLVPPSAPEL